MKVIPLETRIECEDRWCDVPIMYHTQVSYRTGKWDYARARRIAKEHFEKTGHTVRVEQNRTEVFFKSSREETNVSRSESAS